MKQSLVILLFTLIFVSAAMAEPFGFGGRGGRRGGRNKNTAVASATGSVAAAAATTTTAAAAATTTAAAAGANTATSTSTSAAAAAATTAANTGNNAFFNQDAQDGQPSAQACDISKLSATNGQQRKSGGQSCANTQLGEIPDISQMVSTVILGPTDGQVIPANQPFNVTAKTLNMNLGFFDNPDTQYYAFSQQLDKNGLIMGHQHVTIQQITDPTQPLDPTKFSFFKGLNDATNNGILSVAVSNGLSAGAYRLCTMTGAFGHQPVIMPVAQRGAQDDCVRFLVK